MYKMDTLNKGVSHFPDSTEQDSERDHVTQNSTQFKSYELFLQFSI
jgi:hypothetical protein